MVVPPRYRHDFSPEIRPLTIQVMAYFSWHLVNLGFCALTLALLWAVEKR